MENLSDGWLCRPRAGGYRVVGKGGGSSSKKSGCQLRWLDVQVQSRWLRCSGHITGGSSIQSGCRRGQLSSLFYQRPGRGEPVENLSDGWLCRHRAGGYRVVCKGGGSSSKKSECRLRRWVCTGPEPAATTWSAKEEDAPRRSLGANSDGWMCRFRVDGYDVLAI